MSSPRRRHLYFGLFLLFTFTTSSLCEYVRGRCPRNEDIHPCDCLLLPKHMEDEEAELLLLHESEPPAQRAKRSLLDRLLPVLIELNGGNFPQGAQHLMIATTISSAGGAAESHPLAISKPDEAPSTDLDIGDYGLDSNETAFAYVFNGNDTMASESTINEEVADEVVTEEVPSTPAFFETSSSTTLAYGRRIFIAPTPQRFAAPVSTTTTVTTEKSTTTSEPSTTTTTVASTTTTTEPTTTSSTTTTELPTTTSTTTRRPTSTTLPPSTTTSTTTEATTTTTTTARPTTTTSATTTTTTRPSTTASTTQRPSSTTTSAPRSTDSTTITTKLPTTRPSTTPMSTTNLPRTLSTTTTERILATRQKAASAESLTSGSGTDHFSLWETLLVCRNIRSSRVLEESLRNFNGYHFNFLIFDSCKLPNPFPFSLFSQFSFDWLEFINITSMQFTSFPTKSHCFEE